MAKQAPTMEVTATVYNSTWRRVDDFTECSRCLGNVAVCFSGGGSRALTAATGQLRALRKLGFVSMVKAISSVSGGTWASVPFTYLPEHIDDDVFLGPIEREDDLSLERLEKVAPEFLGAVPTSPDISLVPVPRKELTPGEFDELKRRLLSLNDSDHEAAARLLDEHFGGALVKTVLWTVAGLPLEQIWTSLVAHNVLQPFGLAKVDGSDGSVAPSFFCRAESEGEIRRRNPFLPVKAHLVRLETDLATIRPFHVANTAIFANPTGFKSKDKEFAFLAPVQGTPDFVGCLTERNAPVAASDARRKVGHGAISPFAFDSRPQEERDGPRVGEIRAVATLEGSPFSLPELTASSSAVFAEFVHNHLVQLAEEYEKKAHHHGLLANLFLDAFEVLVAPFSPAVSMITAFGQMLGNLLGHVSERAVDQGVGVIRRRLNPRFRYWSPSVMERSSVVEQFADGGSLDNTGLLAALRYEDVDRVIVFVNTPDPIRRSGEHIVVVEDLPPLFGKQPFDTKHGYRNYPKGPEDLPTSESSSLFAFNMVFASAEFERLKKGLESAKRDGPSGAAVFLQKGLEVLANDWWDIHGGRQVDVLWVYLDGADKWRQQLPDQVAEEVRRMAADPKINFPNYPTFEPHLSPLEVNLLAQYTSWVVLQHRAELAKMFSSP